MENDCSVSEDEIYGSVDVAFTVELAERVDVEGVLVTDEAAQVEDGEVGSTPQGHCLVIARPCVVLEGDAFGYEIVCHHGCRSSRYKCKKLFYMAGENGMLLYFAFSVFGFGTTSPNILMSGDVLDISRTLSKI